GWVKNNQDGFIGRRVYDMSNAVARSSFDLRNSSLVAGGAQKLGISTRGMGTGSKVGYEEALNKKIEDRKARYGRIKTDYTDSDLSQGELNSGNKEAILEAKNRAGAAAKQKFYASQGTGGNTATKYLGITTTKEKVGAALLEEDRASGIKDDQNINKYTNAKPDRKQSIFKAADPSLQNQFLKIDKANAEDSEGKSFVYDASQGERRQAIFNR